MRWLWLALLGCDNASPVSPALACERRPPPPPIAPDPSIPVVDGTLTLSRETCAVGAGSEGGSEHGTWLVLVTARDRDTCVFDLYTSTGGPYRVERCTANLDAPRSISIPYVGGLQAPPTVAGCGPVPVLPICT